MLSSLRRVGGVVLLAACSGSRNRAPSEPPPRAEFLLSSADSSFWVATTSGQARVRGVPLTLARYGGRFYEVYVADDDRSYTDALLVGERLYRRDLLTGDSALVFADTTVPRIAGAYSQAHPGETPLRPDDEVEANPGTSATAQLDILGIFGPFLSYEYHVDVKLPGREPWHTTRQGVLDLRSGREAWLRTCLVATPANASRRAHDNRIRRRATPSSVLAAR